MPSVIIVEEHLWSPQARVSLSFEAVHRAAVYCRCLQMVDFIRPFYSSGLYIAYIQVIIM